MTDTLTATPEATAPAAYEFTAKDRCDACYVAQAHVRVTTLAGELLFCGHHYYVNEAEIAAVAVTVEGGTDHLRTNRAIGDSH